MGVVQNLAALALRPFIEGARTSGNEVIDGVWIERLVACHDRVMVALQQANDQTWEVLEFVLAGESFWERVKDTFRRNADQPCRRQVRTFLDNLHLIELSEQGTELRQQCLDELRAARSQGMFLLGGLELGELAQQASACTSSAGSSEQALAENRVLDEISNEFRNANFVALAQLLSLRSVEDTHLLVSSSRFFLNLAVGDDPELTEGWVWAPLAQEHEIGLSALAEAQAFAGSRLQELLEEVRVVSFDGRSPSLDLKAEMQRHEGQAREVGQEVMRLLEIHGMESRHLLPGDSLVLNDETLLLQVKEAIVQYRTLPESQRVQQPALLDGVGRLEVAIGEYEAAQRDFQHLAAIVDDAEGQAEAHFNTYQAALERREWDEAALALQQTLALAPERFAPFPPAKFELERILGAGGFGVTFLCRGRQAGDRVVVRALRVDVLEREVPEIFRELQVLKEAQHPAIVPLRDCDYVRGDKQRPYLVTDFFEGQTLADYVDQHGVLLPTDVLALLQPLAEGLLAAHNLGVWHRDLAPANLLVRKTDDAWEIKLINFGLSLKQPVIHATIGCPSIRSHTAIGHSVTAAIDYVAPEQMGWVDGVAAGPYSDVYGFGKIGYFAFLRTPEPDDEEKETLSEPWRRLLGGCTTRTLAKRLAGFTTVLERLTPIGEEALADRPGVSPAVNTRQSHSYHAEPKDAQGFNDRGVAYANRGAYDRAIADFTQSLEFDPNLAQAYQNRGDVYRLKGEYDRAIADFGEALRIDPKHVLAYINQGRTYRLKGDHDRAIADFTRALRVDPRSADAYNNRGNALADKGDYERAIHDYTEALTLDPNLGPAYLNRSLAHAKRGEFHAVIIDCNEALRLNSKLTSAYFIRGAAHASCGEHDKAIADFTRVLRLDPKYALAYNDRGLALANKGEYDRAIADYTQALRFDSKLVLAFMNRAIAYRLKGDNDRSISELTKLLRLYPKNAVAFTNRGMAFFAKNDFDRAITDYTEALWIDPNHTEAYNRRVEAFRSKNELTKFEEEKRQREDATKEEREQRSNRATAHFTRAQMHFENGRFVKAIADYTEALKYEAKDAFTHYHRGLAHAANDDNDKALSDFTEAIRIDPKLTIAFYQRGIACRLRGNYARAVADFTETIRLDPKHALAYRNRGLARAAMGEQAKAKTDYEVAIHLDPTLGKK